MNEPRGPSTVYHLGRTGQVLLYWSLGHVYGLQQFLDTPTFRLLRRSSRTSCERGDLEKYLTGRISYSDVDTYIHVRHVS